MFQSQFVRRDTTRMQVCRILVTGGAGFVGSNLIRFLLRETEAAIVNVDKLCYAGSAATIDDIQQSPKHRFEHMDICAAREIGKPIEDVKSDSIFHLAASRMWIDPSTHRIPFYNKHYGDVCAFGSRAYTLAKTFSV
ncbi:MAG: NAD-dependent epimerase/dehydratase family protein [Gammaproteobacteria bacterium]